MHEKDFNDDTLSPIQLLAGCATFPFSLVYWALKKNGGAEPVAEPRNKKNSRQYFHDHSQQYRRRQHAAFRCKAPPDQGDRLGRTPKVVKQRGGKEEYKENVSRKSVSSGRKKSVHNLESSAKDHTQRASTPVKEERKTTYIRGVAACCDSAQGLREVGSKLGNLQVDSCSFNKNSMCRDCIEKYEKGIQMNYVRNLTILWFPPNFSQSRFGDRSTGSNACTLICILVSYKCHKTSLRLPNIRMQEVWEPLMNILAESIVEGNSIHERLRKDKKLVEDNLTVPEAISATRNHVQRVIEWESNIVTARMKTSLFDFLSNKVMHWYSVPLSQTGSDLYVVVISVNRSVVMIFQRESETVTLVDSHSHHPHGAAIAQVPFKKLRQLCNWYSCMLKDSSIKPIVQYELSYLYFG